MFTLGRGVKNHHEYTDSRNFFIDYTEPHGHHALENVFFNYIIF